MYPQSPHPYTCRPSGLSPPLIWGPLATLPLTLGNAAEELECHWQAEQVVQEWDLEAFHALLMLLFEPEMAADYSLIYHICSKETEVPGVPGAGLEIGPKSSLPCPAQEQSSQEQRSLVFSSYIFCVDRRSLPRGALWASVPGVSVTTSGE